MDSPKTTLKDIFIYSGFYLALLLITLPSSADGQTKLMLAVVSAIATLVTIVYGGIATLLLFNRYKFTRSAIIKGILFFIVSELSVLTVDGQLPFFGIFATIPPAGNDPDMTEALTLRLFEYRHRVAMMFSISGIGAALLYIIIKLLAAKKSPANC